MASTSQFIYYICSSPITAHNCAVPEPRLCCLLWRQWHLPHISRVFWPWWCG